MYSGIVRVEVQQQHLEEFSAAIARNARASVRDEPGCLRFEVTALADGLSFMFSEVYNDREAFEVAHRGTQHYADWRATADRVLVPGSQTIETGDLIVSERVRAQ